VKKILLINPSVRSGYIFAPYLWLCLKSHYREFGRHAQQWEWLPPLYDIDYQSFDSLLASIVKQKPDVLGFSMLLWNAQLNHLLAAAIKRELPNCKIIAGGPHLNHRYQPDWFQENSAFDLICNPDGYGEEFMTALLDQTAVGEFHPQDIPNAIYPEDDRTNWRSSPLKTDKRKFIWPASVYSGSEDYLKELSQFAKFTGKKLVVAIETLRGCPYGCVYCEWGGGIMTKMNIKPDETLEREFAFLSQLDVDSVHVNDPNFGILPRDLEIARVFVEMKKSGKLSTVWFGGKNKNNKSIVEKIDRLFLEAGLIEDGFRFSVNALDEKQLKAIRRTNLSIEEHIEMLNRIREDHEIDANFELILGLPESNLESIFSEYDLYDRAELWATERYPWALLPETPANHPEYRQQYQLKAVKAASQVDDFLWQSLATDAPYNLLHDPQFRSTFEAVVETASYSKEEWVEMFLVDNCVRAFECSRFTSAPRKWLRDHAQVAASQFFKILWQEIRSWPHIESMRRQLQSFVEGQPGAEANYLWFPLPNDSSKKLRAEASFNELVLSNPQILFDSLKRAFKNQISKEWADVLARTQLSILKNQSPDLCTQITKIKVSEIST
jgi:putative methyltransferase